VKEIKSDGIARLQPEESRLERAVLEGLIQDDQLDQVYDLLHPVEMAKTTVVFSPQLSLTIIYWVPPLPASTCCIGKCGRS
jgi:hypothetical protein